MAVLTLAWRRLRRGWRSGELLVLAFAVIVAVAADAAVGTFSARVAQALEDSSGEALGADRLLTSREPLPPALLEQVRALGLRSAATVTTASAVLAGEDTSLASVKAVSDGYPLRGALRIAPEPLIAAAPTRAIPPPGEAWADPRLWTALKLARGAQVQVGSARLRVVASLEYEPDRGGGFADLAPRLLINVRDLPATGLVEPGSRVQYTEQFSGPAPALAALDRLELPIGVRRLGPQDARPEIRESLKRAGRFLDLAVLAAALLAGCAIAIAAQRHARKLADEVALLKCLGAPARRISLTMTLSLLLLGLVACLAGLALGYGVQLAIGAWLGALLKLTLPVAPFAPLWQAAALGILLLAGFALPPVAAARRTPPVRIFQRADAESPRSRLLRIAIVLIVGLMLWLATGDLQLAGIVLGAAAAGAALLAGIALALVALLKPLQRRAGVAWRFGLANIARHRGAAVAQIVVLGLALHALLLISLGRQDLLSAWQKRLPPDTPNQFLVNVQRVQLDPLAAFFRAHGLQAPQFMPMARARLLAINGEPVSAERFDDPEARNWINREFNLSWTAELPPDNRIIQGQWWGAAGRGRPEISADKYAIEHLGLKLGDRLQMQLAERRIELTVTNFRTVRWDSFKPNFFLLVPPAVIEDAPAQWITSFYLPPEQRGFVRELAKAFPNVTVLDVDQLMGQVREMIRRLVRALESLLLFTLAAGLAVLAALMDGAREQRATEVALLRALGAGRRTVAQGLLAEYGMLGALAGGVAALLAQGVVWALARFVFDLPYTPRPWLMLSGAGIGSVLVAGLAWLSLRKVLRTPPRQVLQSV